MSRKGEANSALLAGLYGSSFGGVFSAMILMLLTPVISAIAIKFGAPEMFALGLWGITMVAGVVGGDVLKGFMMAVLGLLIGTVGAAPSTGEFRFTFGSYYMISGFALVPLLLGCLALSGVYEMIENLHSDKPFFAKQKEKKYYLGVKEVFKHWLTIIRSAITGCIVGIAPAAGPTIASMMCYNLAKQASKEPETYGEGNVDGVWASESANNAATGGSLVFTLSLGIPGCAAAAVLLGALIMRGIQPGPLLLVNQSGLVYTFFAGFLVVNIIVWFFGHVFVQLGAKILQTPLGFLAPSVIVFAVIGAYSDNNSVFGVYMALSVSIVAYFLIKMKFPMAPFLLSLILSPIIESNFWTMHSMFSGEYLNLLKRPMFLMILLIALVSIGLPLLRQFLSKKQPPQGCAPQNR
jgi:putative tricarboxylic transport membrane protein